MKFDQIPRRRTVEDAGPYKEIDSFVFSMKAYQTKQNVCLMQLCRDGADPATKIKTAQLSGFFVICEYWRGNSRGVAPTFKNTS